MKSGELIVPNNPTIPFIEGDGVGAEITNATQAIVDSAVRAVYGSERQIEWLEVLAGEKAFNQTGEWLPLATTDSFREHIVGIKGPLTTPIGDGIRSLNVALRQELDLFVCLRPVRWYSGIESPIKSPQSVDMHIFRENTEDIYSGIEWMQGTDEAIKFRDFLINQMGVTAIRFPETSSYGVKNVSIEGSQRLVRSAIEYALERGLPTLTIVHKGNIMKFTEGGFKKWGYELAHSEFGDRVFTQPQFDQIAKQQGRQAAELARDKAKSEGKLIVNDVITDAMLQATLLQPQNFSVIATLNLNGDYLSDQLAAMVGGIGIAPGANINYLSGHAIFEATHGTAPLIAGENCVNPCSLLLSAVMMLQYIGWSEAAVVIEQALEQSFESGRATNDLARFMTNGKTLTTTEFRDEIVERVNKK